MANKKLIVGVLLIVLWGLFYVTFRGWLSGNAVANDEPPSLELVSDVETGSSIGERGEKFLTTKSTGGRDLGCGPPDDFDCGLNRYSGYMALTNLQMYEDTKDKNYLEYAIKFATTEQTSPPEWCLSCTCNPPDDLDCGMGEIQAEMTDLFAKLYLHTGEDQYLEYAERFAHTMPTLPPEGKEDTLCKPPEDFDCGETHVQSAHIGNYELLYELTGDPKYVDYVKGLGDAWMGATIEEKGPAIVSLFLRINQFTGDEKYSGKAIELGMGMVEACDKEELESMEWGLEPFADFDETAHIVGLTTLYQFTREGRYLGCVKNLLEYGPQCKERVCRNMVQQASMILILTELFRTTESPEYLELAEEFAGPDKIGAVQSNFFGYTTSCKDFDCEDAEDQAYIASALLELGKAKESAEART